MKVPLLVVLLAALGFAQSGAPPSSQSVPPQSIPVDQENARKAKALIDQAIEALGGQAYLGIQDVSQEGRSYSFYHGRPSSYGIQFWSFYQYPDKERVELTKKRDVAYVYNGDKGYEITYKGTAAADAKDLTDIVRRRQYALDWVLRHWINEAGVALFYDGTAVAADKPAEQVTILNARNQGVTLDFDSTTHLPLKKAFSWRDPTDKERNLEEELYDNYRPVQGVMTPFSVTRFYNGDMSSQRFLNSVSYNQRLAASLFQAQVTYDPQQPVPRK